MEKQNLIICDTERCLRDCGCSDEDICRYLACESAPREQLRLLYRERLRLLENLRAAERRIDCLDYLIRALEKEQKQ